MTMRGDVALQANRATVWAALNDPEVLKAAIPDARAWKDQRDGISSGR